ncbi:MAG TPA: hypothetical protein VN702_16015, partial [Acetobacteraceae bacterium]|nr:hypothetical protein [Acetobacteraceae bacterium]
RAATIRPSPTGLGCFFHQRGTLPPPIVSDPFMRDTFHRRIVGLTGPFLNLRSKPGLMLPFGPALCNEVAHVIPDELRSRPMHRLSLRNEGSAEIGLNLHRKDGVFGHLASW